METSDDPIRLLFPSSSRKKLANQTLYFVADYIPECSNVKLGSYVSRFQSKVHITSLCGDMKQKNIDAIKVFHDQIGSSTFLVPIASRIVRTYI
ncbi:hypothetical protein J5N97_024823 [Dioscorea zingiberensis]|uniref:Uncharacterized protein n=1 Tax=Dioscorea zingiberensis TaxID=325984 RepID=A0A9D5H8Z2_9LILI|nr:hypothetical protein J5N97_024823 [Dioscorea zingiberensis]